MLDQLSASLSTHTLMPVPYLTQESINGSGFIAQHLPPDIELPKASLGCDSRKNDVTFSLFKT
jgi:hypothetical protein